MSTTDKATNKTQELKGEVKEAVGSATGHDDLEKKGKSDQAKASVKGAGESIKDAVSTFKDAVTGR